MQSCDRQSLAVYSECERLLQYTVFFDPQIDSSCRFAHDQLAIGGTQPTAPTRSMKVIGDSVTGGIGSDESSEANS